MRVRGFSLVEVLVALTIISVGMLGVGKMMMTSLKSSGTAYGRTQAMAAANSIMDRMRANRTDSGLGAGSTYQLSALTTSAAYGAGPNCITATCSAAALAQHDIANWLAGLSSASGLPNGRGSIVLRTVNNQVNVTVTVAWDDSVAQKALAENVAAATLTLTSNL